MSRLFTALCVACALGSADCAADPPSPNPDCEMALASATALADRFDQGDASLTWQDAADLAWVTMPEYHDTLAMRGCAQMHPQFESVAMSGLRSTRIDVRALLLRACTVRIEPADDRDARVAKEALREEGTAGLKALGVGTSACSITSKPGKPPSAPGGT